MTTRVRQGLALALLIAVAGPHQACVRRSYERSTATITHHGGRERAEEAPEPAEEPDAGTASEEEPPPDELIVPDLGETEPAEGLGGVDERPAIEVLEGRASFYADRFEGRSTASGEPYRAAELTAASRDLPFGTIVRVVRVDTGTSVVVRVNDRGPFGDHARILDLSRSAAEALDMIRAGVIDIRAEILERGDGRRSH